MWFKNRILWCNFKSRILIPRLCRHMEPKSRPGFQRCPLCFEHLHRHDLERHRGSPSVGEQNLPRGLLRTYCTVVCEFAVPGLQFRRLHCRSVCSPHQRRNGRVKLECRSRLFKMGRELPGSYSDVERRWQFELCDRRKRDNVWNCKTAANETLNRHSIWKLFWCSKKTVFQQYIIGWRIQLSKNP